ncbi:SEC10/PgrA surface exclusion domain-containing protein, partial [Lactobacillaceae bacterium 24-114]
MTYKKIVNVTLLSGLITTTSLFFGTSNVMADTSDDQNQQTVTIDTSQTADASASYVLGAQTSTTDAQNISFPQGYTLDALKSIGSPQAALNFEQQVSKQVYENDSTGYNPNDYQSNYVAAQEKVDISNLTNEQINELNLYGLSLVNQARTTFGKEPFTQNQSTINAVKEMTLQYQDKNESLFTGGYHDESILNGQSENIAANQIYVDNISVLASRPYAQARMEDFKDRNSIPLFTVTTMDDLRALIYYGVIGMLFDDAGDQGVEEFGHAKNFLVYDQPIMTMALYPEVLEATAQGTLYSNGVSTSFTFKVKTVDMHYIWTTGSQSEGFHKVGNSTYYYNKNGQAVTGEFYSDGNWYYFSPETSAMVIGFIKLPDGRIVYYNEEGQLQNGLTKATDGYTYYFSETNGNM